MRGVDLGGVGLEFYKGVISLDPKIGGLTGGGMPGQGKNMGRLREHFMLRHCKSNVAILQEVTEPSPRCDQ